MLARSELHGSNSLVDNKIGLVVPNAAGEALESRGDKRTFAFAVGGICTVSLIIMIAVLATTSSQTAASGPLPNWSLQPALPEKSPQQSNRIHLTGNRLL